MIELTELQSPQDIAHETTPDIAITNNMDNSALEDVITGRSNRRLRRALAILTFSTVGVTVAPHYHEQIDLLGSLAASDVESVFTSTPQVSGEDSSTIRQTYKGLESFGISDGQYKSSEFGWFTSTWIQSRIIDALYVLSLLPGSNQKEYQLAYRQSLAASNEYWDNHPPGFLAGYDAGPKALNLESTGRYVDDALWMAQILMRDYRATKNPKELARVEQIFAMAASQWDEEGGGIYWKEQLPGEGNKSRGVVSNAPFIRLAGELYKQTGKQIYKDWSEKDSGWLKKRLLNKSNELYSDHINANGSVDKVDLTYVEGTVIGANAVLFQIDPTAYPLDNSSNLAYLSMSRFDSVKLEDNTEFKAIYYAELLWAASVYNNPAYTNSVRIALSKTINNTQVNPNNAMSLAGYLELQALQRLPAKDYRLLF